MGHAWCKERTSKAQDSKSPLDRVFVRCAHRIYPGLKEEGSVLGGATQRVTSSEIGYAGSPPREALTRGCSIDSVDRPFQPSDWVDVNLEVPSTPTAGSVLTNITADTNLYPTTAPATSCSNLKNVTPVPPPRNRRKNKGRPLPPKPDEIPQTHRNPSLNSTRDTKSEPLYSSVKSPKAKSNYARDEVSKVSRSGTNKSGSSTGTGDDSKKGKDLYEHKVNGTGRIIPSVVVSARRTNRSSDAKQPAKEPKGHHKIRDAEYEEFSNIQSSQVTSTPNRTDRETTRDLRMLITESADNKDKLELPGRPKNHSTVSLPNYDELEVVKHEVEKSRINDAAGANDAEVTDKDLLKKPHRYASTGSLPVQSILSSFPQKTAERLENYVTRSKSFGSLQPHQILDKLNNEGYSSDEDVWGGLDDYDLGIAEHDEHDGQPPFEPNSRLRERKVSTPKFHIGEESIESAKRSDESKGTVEMVQDTKKEVEEGNEGEVESSSTGIPRSASFNALKSAAALKSALKGEAKRKISMPAKLAGVDARKSPTALDDWFLGQERSVRFFDSPTVEEEYTNTPGFRPARPQSKNDAKNDFESEPYLFADGTRSSPLHCDIFFEADEGFGGTSNTIDSSGGKHQSEKILRRTLSNESEPFDGYEEKELAMDIRSQSSISKLSRTISDESLPQEMLLDVEDFFEEKLAKDVQNKMTKDSEDSTESKTSKTPPPSPEPKIKAEIQDNDHSILLKVLKEEKTGEDSNLSSMTPSLTELEAALSDMLEKEDQQAEVDDAEEVTCQLLHSESGKSVEQPIEPEIVPVEKDKYPEGIKDTLTKAAESTSEWDKKNTSTNRPISLEQILSDSKQEVTPSNGEESKMVEMDLRNGNVSKIKNSVEQSEILEKKIAAKMLDKIMNNTPGNPFEEAVHILESNDSKDSQISTNPFDEPPEKPSRLHKVDLGESQDQKVNLPTPPRRKHRSNSNARKDEKVRRTVNLNPYPNDRLI
ncbi:uncharacterized protein LOC107263532 isoform X2 [Cephus cinctus]|uniref:Uncharacterized protein LOC107263532 isoform X2 n=1 Tax=Cephus cinctus TaxID=211228 RepID=A0AAJ7FDF8_CEPCN|nr:uncharacterized protein LOC107263532 isoform X2 [Cephus cinctus]